MSKDKNPWAKKTTPATSKPDPATKTSKRGSLASLKTKDSNSPRTNSPSSAPSTKANPWSGTSRTENASVATPTLTRSSSRTRSQGEQLSLDITPAPKSRPSTLPPRDDQRVVRQPWAGKTDGWAAHVKRARRMQREFPPDSYVTVSWRWDASSAFSTRPDAENDSFSGTIEKYDELGQMHLHGGPRRALFVIPCAHITDIRGDKK